MSLLSANTWQRLILTLGPGLVIIGIARLMPGIENTAIKTAIALILGPIAGISMHRGSVPGDHLPPTAEAKFEQWRTALADDAARWRRTALVAAATLTIGIAL